ncbi:carbohydrate kinase [Pedobacter sp. HMF7647]|uniref:Carbohydrate kinase n=1 Tax=Hufsiella arboris TaxID=2695275 RepID=A0A7K1Y460_9SPHI|nr:carbohydrate kinase [Hufsiella arboris]MXV49376.1 carbohydrate kinase [Hufsiella arboris]
MKSAVCFGEILWDEFEDEKRIGGAPLNVALHLKKHGVESYIISAAGVDENGRNLIDYCDSTELNTGFIQTNHSLETGVVTVHLNADKHATYTIKQPVAWDEIQFSDEAARKVSEADAFVFGTLACRSKTSRDTLFKLLPSARLKVLDLNLRAPFVDDELIRQLLDKADLVKINEDELLYLSRLFGQKDGNIAIETQIRNLASQIKADNICVTLGDKGAALLFDDKFYSHPGFMIKVADTVGAGDAFLAALINEILQGRPAFEYLRTACAVGAYVASKSGANPAYNPSEVPALIIRNID